ARTQTVVIARTVARLTGGAGGAYAAFAVAFSLPRAAPPRQRPMTTPDLAPTEARAERPSPPVARKIPRVEILHGDERHDDYYWMRDRDNPDVAAYLTAENDYTDAILKPTRDFQGALYAEMLARIKETDMRVPFRKGRFFYYSRTEQGKQYAIQCRREGSLDAPQQATRDLNALAAGGAFMDLGAYTVSDDARLLAFSLDDVGFRQYTLQVKDLETGALLPVRVEKVVSVAWAADDETLFYVVEEDKTKRPHRLFRHRLGTDVHELVYEETDEAFNIGLGRTRSLRHVIL